jgi:hypothetical protein
MEITKRKRSDIDKNIGNLIKRSRNSLDYIFNHIYKNFKNDNFIIESKSKNSITYSSDTNSITFNVAYNSFDQNNDIFVTLSGIFNYNFIYYLLDFLDYSNKYLDTIHIDATSLNNRKDLIQEMKLAKNFIFLEKLYYPIKLFNFEEDEVIKIKNLDDDVIFPLKSVNMNINLFKLLFKYDFNQSDKSLKSIRIISKYNLKNIIDESIKIFNLDNNEEKTHIIVDSLFQSFENQKKITKFDYKIPWISIKNYLFPYLLYNENDNLYINTNIVTNFSDLEFIIEKKLLNSLFSSLFYKEKEIQIIYYKIFGKIFNEIYNYCFIFFEIHDNDSFFYFTYNNVDNDPLININKYQISIDFFMKYLEKNYKKSVCIVPPRDIYVHFEAISKIMEIINNNNDINAICLLKGLLKDKIGLDTDEFIFLLFQNEFEDPKIKTLIILNLYYFLFESSATYDIVFQKQKDNISFKIFDGEKNDLSTHSLKQMINSCSKTQNFIIMGLSFINEKSGHSNIIYIDKKRGTAERFEPHGSFSYEEDILSDLSIKADEVLNVLFENLNLKYISPRECDREGPQLLESPDYRGIEDLSGFCVNWSFFLGLYRIQHPYKSYFQSNFDFKNIFEKYSLEYGSKNIIVGFFKRELAKIYNEIQSDIDIINKRFNINLHYKN